jgi:hypothetical protein
MLVIPINFFVDHQSTASITPHIGLLGFIPHASSPVHLQTFIIFCLESLLAERRLEAFILPTLEINDLKD